MEPQGDNETAIELLAAAFPHLGISNIAQALQSAGNDAHLAAASLLDTPADASAEADGRAPPCAPPRQPVKQQRKVRSWGELHAAAGVKPPPVQLKPRYVPARAPAPARGSAPGARAAATAAAAQPVPQQQQPSTADHLRQLATLYPWADAELLALVLEAAGGDAELAAALLCEMAPESSSAAGGGALSAALSSASQQPSRTCSPAAAFGCIGAAGLAADVAQGAAHDDEPPEEAYYLRFRRPALKLMRQWQRAARQAAAAFAAGDPGSARQLAAEARRLRVESLAEHAAAAERIEEHVNRDNSLLELDLHGLHGSEATAALDRRLALLQQLADDLPRSSASSRGGGGSAGSSSAVLRVVVGRGLHSSAGDASLPRVVAAHLQAAGLRVTERTGALDVQLPRQWRR